MIELSRKHISQNEVEDLKNTEEVYYYSAEDSLLYRYEVLSTVKSYARFKLYRCRDHKEGTEVVARVQHSKWTKQAEEEVSESNNQLKLLEDSDLLIAPLESKIYRGQHCFIYPLSILNESIRQKQSKVLKNSKNFAKELLSLLQSFHSKNIALCSFSPENIIDTSEDPNHFSLKLLGLECHQTTFQNYEFLANSLLDQELKNLAYIPPEVLLGLPTSQKVDIWCFGALLMDILQGSTSLSQFQDFNSYFQKLLNPLGPPQNIDEYLSEAKNKHRLYSEEEQKPLFTLEDIKREEIEAHPILKDLIRKCVRWESENRVSVEEGLAMFEKQEEEEVQARTAVEESLGMKEQAFERRNGSV